MNKIEFIATCKVNRVKSSISLMNEDTFIETHQDNLFPLEKGKKYKVTIEKK